MQAFTCDKCQTVHNYDKIQSVTLCDACKQPLGSGRHECCKCYDNEVDPVYHKNCVVKLEGNWYCSTHRVKKEKAMEAAIIIRKYAEAFWAELGGKVLEYKDTQRAKREFRVDFDAITLQVSLIPETKNGLSTNGYDDDDDENVTYEIIALHHEVSGIKVHGSSTFRAGIHNHQDALEQVAAALIRSLRSKKSALTVERKQIDDYAQQRVSSWKDYGFKSKKKAAAAARPEITKFNKKRKKIVDMSNFLVAKLAELKVPKTEPVLV